jgi:NTE family protein
VESNIELLFSHGPADASINQGEWNWMAKTALVLSGGAMFGAYQAGAWSVLGREFQPDFIAATSVGALNGWAIAGGVAGTRLISDWQNPCIARLLARRTGVPFCLFDREGLEAKIDELMHEFSPRIPLGVTVVEVPVFKSRLFIDQQITARHLLATCAVPVGFRPVRIGGRLYVDGGVKSSLPLWAAAEMGATRIVAINALPVLPGAFLKFYSRSLRLLGGAPKPVPECIEVIRIAPEGSLGSLVESTQWDARRIDAWISLGRRDAESMIRNIHSPHASLEVA